MEFVNLEIVFMLTVGFALAGFLGYLTNKVGLSPLLGYLAAGYVVGPFSPGVTVDVRVAEQLAEIGVILMMFGVGLHFKWEDLVSVKSVAIPGALGQTLITAIFSAVFIYALGWSLEAGIIVGLAVGVASTVVLVRVLADNHLLNTLQGHIAVGWLIVEDILTVSVLILLPSLAIDHHEGSLYLKHIGFSVAVVLFKFLCLAAIIFTVGTRLVAYLLLKVARTRSHELFTLAVLGITFVIALGSTVIFGTSIALGAFLAGIVIGRTEVRHQASVHSLPLKDAFVVIFFLSAGMLFDPNAIVANPLLFSGILAIILLIKPLVAFLIVYVLRYSAEVCLTVAFALAQIGEFSFILAEGATRYKILPDAGYDIIVACALVTISLNPVLFRWIKTSGNWVEEILKKKNPEEVKDLIASQPLVKRAIIVGFGPIGRVVYEILDKNSFFTVVIDSNVDTVSELLKEGKTAIYGNAARSDIQEAACLDKANLLIVTLPNMNESIHVVEIAQELNEGIHILVRTRYLSDKSVFENLGIPCICCEEEEVTAFQEAIMDIIPTFA